MLTGCQASEFRCARDAGRERYGLKIVRVHETKTWSQMFSEEHRKHQYFWSQSVYTACIKLVMVWTSLRVYFICRVAVFALSVRFSCGCYVVQLIAFCSQRCSYLFTCTLCYLHKMYWRRLYHALFKHGILDVMLVFFNDNIKKSYWIKKLKLLGVNSCHQVFSHF